MLGRERSKSEEKRKRRGLQELATQPHNRPWRKNNRKKYRIKKDIRFIGKM